VEAVTEHAHDNRGEYSGSIQEGDQ
jgi:hypothetical protein